MCRVLPSESRCGVAARGAHPLGQQQHLELDVEGTFALVGLVEQVIERCRIAFRPCRLGGAERRQRLGRDDPGRDGRGEVLGQEGPERLVLPGLDVARRPVVQQAVAGHVLGRLPDRDRVALLVAGADPDAELELVVEVAAGAEARAPSRPGACAGRSAGEPARRTDTTVEARP